MPLPRDFFTMAARPSTSRPVACNYTDLLTTPSETAPSHRGLAGLRFAPAPLPSLTERSCVRAAPTAITTDTPTYPRVNTQFASIHG